MSRIFRGSISAVFILLAAACVSKAPSGGDRLPQGNGSVGSGAVEGQVGATILFDNEEKWHKTMMQARDADRVSAKRNELQKEFGARYSDIRCKVYNGSGSAYGVRCTGRPKGSVADDEQDENRHEPEPSESRDRNMWVRLPSADVACGRSLNSTNLGSGGYFSVLVNSNTVAIGLDEIRQTVVKTYQCNAALAQAQPEKLAVYVNIHTAEVVPEDGSFSQQKPEPGPAFKFDAQKVQCGTGKNYDGGVLYVYYGNSFQGLWDKTIAKGEGGVLEMVDRSSQCFGAVKQAIAFGGAVYVNTETAEVIPENGFYRRTSKP